MAKETEIEVLDRILVPSDWDWVPPAMAKRFGPMSDLEIEKEILARGENIKSIVMAQQGWALLTVKNRKKHGEFENWLKEINWPYDQANLCMNLARGLARHPGLQHIGNGKILRDVLYLPEWKQAEIEVEFSTVDDKGKKKTWKELRPWVLRQVYRQTRKEITRSKRREKKIDTRLPPENRDQEWMTVKDKWSKAVNAMEDVVAACKKVKKWKTEYVQEALAKKMVIKLGDPWDDIVKFLHPIEEMRLLGMCED